MTIVYCKLWHPPTFIFDCLLSKYRFVRCNFDTFVSGLGSSKRNALRPTSKHLALFYNTRFNVSLMVLLLHNGIQNVSSNYRTHEIYEQFVIVFYVTDSITAVIIIIIITITTFINISFFLSNFLVAHCSSVAVSVQFIYFYTVFRTWGQQRAFDNNLLSKPQLCIHQVIHVFEIVLICRIFVCFSFATANLMFWLC